MNKLSKAITDKANSKTTGAARAAATEIATAAEIAGATEIAAATEAMLPVALQEKLAALRCTLAELDSVAVGFSGGVDSSLLLYLAHEALDERAVAFTVCSYLAPTRELHDADAFCAEHGISHRKLELPDAALESIKNNPQNRCYLCKRVIFEKIADEAQALNLATVAEGSNLDDESDYRPGKQALLELGVLSPLKEAGFTKQDIRTAAHALGLSVWDKPACACLATRLPFDTPLEQSTLKRIDAAEEWLIKQGLTQVRVRVHGTVARIECNEEGFLRLAERAFQKEAHEKLRNFGFEFVTLDLRGFTSGSMNSTSKVMQSATPNCTDIT
jgi:uncharacterized protein